MNMKRILIIGCPGSGKSTFARALREVTGLPLYYLDMLYHKPDKTIYPLSEFDRKLKIILAQDTWIIDGNYTRTLPMRLECCDTVFWLDYPLEISLSGIAARMGQPREDMPWIETEPDPEFLDYIKNFNQTRKPEIKAVLQKSPEKNVVIFHTRAESESFLEQFKANLHAQSQRTTMNESIGRIFYT